MSRSSHAGPKLPASILDSVGSARHGTTRSRNFRVSKPVTRKDQRKASRMQKKQSRIPSRHEVEEGRERSKERRAAPPKTSVVTQSQQPQDKINTKPMHQRALEVNSQNTVPLEQPDHKPRLPQAVRAKLDEDDADIAALERKLGVKGKARTKKPSGDEDDDFEALLAGLDDYDDGLGGKRKRSDYDDFLTSKRSRQQLGSEFDEDEATDEDESEFSDDSMDDSIDESLESDHDRSDIDGDAEFLGFDEDLQDVDEDLSQDKSEDNTDDVDDKNENASHGIATPPFRENPYVAPIPALSTPTGKYVPPSMRKQRGSGTEDLSALRRQLKGLLNRLSESNMLSIVRDMETIYASNARQHVTTVLIDLLMGQLCDRSALMDTFIILHAGFAAAIYKVVGAHFGAQLLERVVHNFDAVYASERASQTGTKEPANLIALLAELYTFQVVGANIMFDYIRLLLDDLSELNTELLLKIVKNCGSQLRHDDPSALKDIVILLHKSVAKAGEEQLPVRTKFMIETINDLKNNRVKAGAAASIVAAEQTTRLKKTLGTLGGQTKSTEPLGVGLSDIKSSNKEGKWWLVGASWKNDVQGLDTVDNDEEDHRADRINEGSQPDEVHGEDLLVLAKEQRMNTDIRRAIFLNIMSAEDFKDAYTRLLKLKLKKAQELEIPRVLIHCASAEQAYNPYYTFIAKRLCAEHRYKWAMQYGLWDLFKRMGEKSDAPEGSDDESDDQDDEAVDLYKVVNLGRMYGQLIGEDAMSLTLLKVLNFAYLQPRTKSFLEVLFGTIFKSFSKKAKADDSGSITMTSGITNMLTRAKDVPQVITGLQYFLSKEADLESIASSSSERKMLKRASKMAVMIATQLAASFS